jgi:uridine phosphorylase
MNKIASSELIINARGAVYHLDLTPEEIADTIITVGDPGRVEKISRHFDHLEHQSTHREFITHTGRIGNKRLSVLSTGIGTDNIDIVMNELDSLFNIDLDSRLEKTEKKQLNIIRLGTAGALQKDIAIDSIVASTHGIGLDNLMHFYPFVNNHEEMEIIRAFNDHTQLGSKLSAPYVFGASAFLLAKLVDQVYAGLTVSCPGFYAPQGRNIRLGLSNPNLIEQLQSFGLGNHRILNFEMETSAIYGLGKCMGHRCISFSSIIANRISKEFSSNVDLTVERLINYVLERIEGV